MRQSNYAYKIPYTCRKRLGYILGCYTTTSYSPFEVVYGFNPTTPLDLMPIPVNERDSLDGKKKAKLVKSIHEMVRLQIEKKNEQYASHANKGRRHITFEPGDWVWVHIRKERFPAQRRSKLNPREDGPFQILEKINDNAYKVDLLGEYNVSATFNVVDLSPFDVGEDSRSNLRREGMMSPLVDRLVKLLFTIP